MVGAIEEPARGLRVGGDRPALPRRGPRQPVLEVALALADQDHVASRTGALQGIEGKIRDHRLGRVERMRGIIFGAEQAALLGGPRGEQQGARGARPGSEVAGDLQQAREPKRVVMGAVANAVAIGVGLADAIGVPMA